jgi:hypothetical protein
MGRQSAETPQYHDDLIMKRSKCTGDRHRANQQSYDRRSHGFRFSKHCPWVVADELRTGIRTVYAVCGLLLARSG